MKEFQLDVGSHTIAARAFGDPAGEPTLAIHGWIDNLGSMSALAARLPELNVVAVDLVGHGRSSHRPLGARLHFVDYVADIVQILNRLGWDRCTYLGHSMGAGVGTLLAGSFPHRVRSLVLFEGLGPTTTSAEGAPKRLADSLKAETFRVPRVYPDKQEAFAKFRDSRSWLSDEPLERLFERALREVDGGWVFAHDPRLRLPSILQMTESMVLGFLNAIACPTLVVSATRGWPHDAEQMSHRLQAIKNHTHLIVEGNHHLHMEVSDALLLPLRGFLGL